MKIVIAVLAILTIAAAATATVDPDPDQIGVYFDLKAETTCMDVGISVPFFAYVIITNPTAEVQGFSFAICHEAPPGMEGLVFRLASSWPTECPPPIDTSIIDWCNLGHAQICYSPVPPVPGGVVVMPFQYLLLGDVPVKFYLGPTAGGEAPGYLDPDGAFIPLGISSGSPDLPVAQVNGDCSVVPVEESTFGRVKAIYR